MKKLIFLFLLPLFLYSETIKDISSIIGIRDNKLIGYGLVVGLNGTGDKSKFTFQSKIAKAMDTRVIKVKRPNNISMVKLIARIESIEI